MAIKYTNIFHCKTLQNLPKLGFLVWKYAIWQPCERPDFTSNEKTGRQRISLKDLAKLLLSLWSEKKKTFMGWSSFHS
jgi:hypothetical protein